MKNNFKITYFENEILIGETILKENDSLTIGRHAENDISFSDNLISSKHCVLEFVEGKLFITDLNSKNGTFLNYNKIEQGKRLQIDSNCIITFANNSSKIVISTFSLTIGRSNECDIILNDNAISRKHATIRHIGENQFELIDHNSTNGTFVKGQKISKIILEINDTFIIGRYVFKPDGSFKSLSDQTIVQLQNASKAYKNGSTAIHPLSFSIQPQTLTAIMGPSGCGKSTLLKMILGLSTHTGGNVSLFGFNLIEYFDMFKQYIGYVPQDDVVHEELTVYQSLYFSAKIRLHDKDEHYRLSKINSLLTELNINFIKDNPIGKISGGQRKRLAIAIELLTDPILLLLDEPTSPLDPQSIEEFMTILKNLVEKGTTVLMVTHKPEDLTYMDEVIFLAEGGYFAYKGSTSEYLSYFKTSSTINVYSQLSGQSAEKWKMTTSEIPYEYNIIQQDLEYKRVNWFNQLYWLSVRNLKIKINDHLNSSIILLQAPIIALLIGFIFSDLTLSVLFMMIVSAIWFGVNNASREIVKEQNIYYRENLFNVLPITYLSSKVIVLIIVAILQTLLFVIVLKMMYSSTLSPLVNTFDAFSWLVFINIASALLGLLLSAAMKTTDKVLSLVPLVLIPQIMLSGVITPINNKAVEILSYLTFSRWGVEGLSHIQNNITTTQITSQTDSTSLQQSASEIEFVTQSLPIIQNQYHKIYSDIFGSSYGSFTIDFLMITSLSLLLFLSTYLLIKQKSA